MNNIKQPLIKEIAELREELATLNIDLESAQLVRDAAEELYGTEAFFDFFMENADEMRMKNGKVEFLSNKAGGILGGISTGQDVVVRFAVKPTSSILTPRKTVTTKGRNAEVATRGRHDPCVGIRGVPVGEAMMACVLADPLLRHRGQNG